jgi:hypothetical protein
MLMAACDAQQRTRSAAQQTTQRTRAMRLRASIIQPGNIDDAERT